MGTRILTNPSPNLRTPRAVSRRRTLRRSRSKPLIGGAAEVDLSQKLRDTLGAFKRLSSKIDLGLGCATLWSSYHYSVLGAALVGEFPRESCQRVHQSDGREDPPRSQHSGPDVWPGVSLTNAIGRRHARCTAS